MNGNASPANVGSNDGLGRPPERATMRLTLADLGVLAATAERNGTQHAFQAVALQWCGQAQAEIERLRMDLENTRAEARLAVAAERERIFAHIRSALGHAEAGYDDVAWRLLAWLVGPNGPGGLPAFGGSARPGG